jgi:hypothetical protein
MLRLSRTNKAIAAVAAFAVYFALAAWSKWTWVDPVPKGRVVVRLDRPFEISGAHGVTSYQLRSQEIFESIADIDDDPARSPLLLYEDNHLLGPPHSRVEEVGQLGQGRYLHARKGLVFSASDNGDINKSKRVYWAVLPN